jgi:hypothetical protein
MKAIKIGAMVIGAVALIATGVGAVALGGLAGTLTVAGISTSTLFMISGGLSVAASLLQKTPKVPASQTERLNATVDPRSFRKTVLGQTAMPVEIRYEEWSGKDQEYGDWVVLHASHAIDGIEEIWFDTNLAWSATTGVAGKYRNYFWVQHMVLEGSPANAFSFGAGKWNSATARLTGCAYSHWRFKVTGNSKKAESPFASGLPSRITVIGRGAKLYDPRRDSTVPGGSGPMRASDQSTWRYRTDDGAVIGENLPLQILRVVLGWRIRNPATGVMKLATGSGVPARRLSLASFIVAANLADEQVNRSAGGTEPRYHGAGVISEGDDPKSTLDMLCTACCSKFRDTGGKLSLNVAHNDLAAAATDDGLNDDDVVGPFTWDPDAALEATPNVVRGKYVDASTNSLYQMIDYPEVRLPSPDGQDRYFPLDLAVVESPSQAQRIARQILQRKQYPREFAAPFDIRAWKYSVGDVVPFTFAPLGFARRLFRVKDQELGQGGVCNMTLTVEAEVIYSWDAYDAAPVQAAEAITYDSRNNPLILAIDEAATTALWDAVADPNGTKPDDNATNSADPASPIGGKTVRSVLEEIEQANQDIDDLVAAFGSSESADASAAAAKLAATASQTARDQSVAARDAAAQAVQDAGNYAGQASQSKGSAEQAKTLAEAARAAAAQKASDAAESATSAGGSATTASGQATIATQKADAAGQSASTASAKADIASTKAGEASTSASSAATSESNSLGSKNSAALSAAVSASTYQALLQVTGDDAFDNGLDGWVQVPSGGTGVPVLIPTGTGRSNVLSAGNFVSAAYVSKKRHPVTSVDQKFALSGSFRKSGGLDSGNSVYIGFFSYDANGARIEGDGFGNYPLAFNEQLTNGQWVDRKVTISKSFADDSYSSYPGVSGRGGRVAIPAAAVSIAPVFFLNFAGGNEAYQIDHLSARDVTSELAAAGSAAAASGSVSTAAASATAAGQSATAADASRSQAQTAAGAAETSRGAAATSESNALGSKNAAASSASVSASSAAAAINAAAANLPQTFENGGQYVSWTGNTATYPNIAGTVVLQVVGGDYGYLTPRAWLPAVAGDRWHVRIELRNAGDATTLGPGAGYFYGNSNAAEAAAAGFSGAGLVNITSTYNALPDGVWKTIEYDIVVPTNPPGPYIKPGAYIYTGNPASTTIQIRRFGVVNATQTALAQAAATAAATSAQSAATSKDQAGESASAADGSRVAAQTAAGQASGFRDQAATSQQTAAGSASTATQQAGLAAQSATAAGGSATAANTSAGTASTKADAAGASASAADVSAQTAAGHRGAAESAAQAAQGSAVAADGAASSASSYVTLAAQRADAAGTFAAAAKSSADAVTNAGGALATRMDGVEVKVGEANAKAGIASQAVADVKTGLAAARLELSATSPGGRASVVIRSDSSNGAGIDIVGDVRFMGKLFVGGSTGKRVQIEENKIVIDNGFVMSARGTGFGTQNQFIEWVGPSRDLALCNEADAVSYITTDGRAYFGGGLSAGILKNAVQTTAIDTGANVTTGTFGSNGRARTVTVSYFFYRNAPNTGTCPASPVVPTATVELHRGTDASGPILSTQTFTGDFQCERGFPSEPGFIGEQIAGGFTFTDTAGGTTAAYFVRLVGRSTNTSPQQQSLGVISTEQ